MQRCNHHKEEEADGASNDDLEEGVLGHHPDESVQDILAGQLHHLVPPVPLVVGAVDEAQAGLPVGVRAVGKRTECDI